MSCKKVENWIESRGCSINELPAELKNHAKICKDCGSFLKAVGLISGSLQKCEIGKADLAEIKTNVFNKIGMTPATSASSASSSCSNLAALLTKPATIIVAAIIATGAIILPLVIRKSPPKNIESKPQTADSVKNVQKNSEQSSAIITGKNARLKDASGKLSELSNDRLQMVSGNRLVLPDTNSRAKLIFSDGTILSIQGSGEISLEENSLQVKRLDAKLILYAGDKPYDIKINNIKTSFTAKKQIFEICSPKNSIKALQGTIDIEISNEIKKLKSGEWFDFASHTIKSVNSTKSGQPMLNTHKPVSASQIDEHGGNSGESAADGFNPD
jgi:hypothetical protein